MKCFSCGKKFNYEKYNGICPKCGCFNKPDIASRQTKGEGDRGCNVFLISSIVCFFLVFLGGTVFRINYGNRLRYEAEQELVEMEVIYEEHELGERFSYQGFSLMFTETMVLDGEQLWPGKKLVAVKLVAESDGQERSQIILPYMKCKDLYYCPIQEYMLENSMDHYGISLFDEFGLYDKSYEEGWCLFLMDEREREFTLHMEERAAETIFFIQTIHSIEIQLEEDGINE